LKKYLFISVGGFIGAVLRYYIKSVELWGFHGNFPLNTLLINIAGCFILALVLTIAYEIRRFDTDLRLGIATGFLGAFTTFSTMCRESVYLFSRGAYHIAISYIALSTMLGLAAVYAGRITARVIGSKKEMWNN
jgi:CrcB protein